jgi:hypothetical protein
MLGIIFWYIIHLCSLDFFRIGRMGMGEFIFDFATLLDLCCYNDYSEFIRYCYENYSEYVRSL